MFRMPRSRLVTLFSTILSTSVWLHVGVMATNSSWQNVSISTSMGKLHGRLFEDHAEFLGVPFATQSRFEPPQLWTEKFGGEGREALAAGPACPQKPGVVPDDAPMAEDCLFLNVFVPKQALQDPAAKMPVMLFIYGGAFIEGSSSQGMDMVGWYGVGPYGLAAGYNASGLVKDRSTIVAFANYRLGALGFMALPEDAAQGKTTGNNGMLDQRMAMAWLRREAGFFGGDPQRLTIFGESAGGISVANHFVMPNSWPHFDRGIVESGFPAAQAMESALDRTAAIAALLNCTTDSINPARQLLGGGAQGVVKSCLREVPVESLLYAQEMVSGGDPLTTGNLVAWFPVIDGVEILEVPMKAVLNGRFKRGAALMAGSNTDEGSLFVFLGHMLGVEGVQAFNTLANQTVNALRGFPKASTEFMANITALYAPGSWPVDNAHKSSHVVTDFCFACASRAFIRALRSQQEDAWLYHFNYRGSCDNLPVDGVYHSSELRYVFNTPYFGRYAWPHWNWTAFDFDEYCFFDEQEQTMSDTMGDMWTQFAATGNPNPSTGQQERWPAYDDSDQNILVELGNITMETGYRKQYCDVWDTFYETWQ